MGETAKRTVIAEGTELNGSMRSKCGVSVSGKLVGELDAPDLTITATGSVDGDVTVSQLKSEGAVSGRIVADTVQLAGRVSDHTAIHARTLEVKLSDDSKHGLQVTFGNCELNIDGHGRRPVHGDVGQHDQQIAADGPREAIVAGSAVVKTGGKPGSAL